MPLPQLPYEAYRIPAATVDEKDKIAWITRTLRQGQSHLESCRAYEDIDRAMDLIGGNVAKRPARLSQLHINRIKRQAREVVGTLSNLRPMWGYKSDNPLYDRHVEILNKLILAWWHTQFIDRSIREALQYAVVLGTGYLSVAWERDLWFAGRGDVALKAHGPKDVTVTGIGADNDIQRAETVAIKTETPIGQARAMYPRSAHRLTPDRNSPSLPARAKEIVTRFASPVLNLVGSSSSPQGADTYPTIDIFNIYIRDTSVNHSGADIPMGEPGTNWAYIVPYVGKREPTGAVGANGDLIVHTVTEEEAMMYPRLRLITCTRSHVISDGPSPWWHGKVPIAQFRTDDWPWEFLGYSLVRDSGPIMDSVNSLYRSVIDSANVRLRPPTQYDRSVVSKAFIDRFDSRQPGARIEVDSSAGVEAPVKPVFDPSQFDVPQWIPEVIQNLEDKADYLCGVQDLTALAKARQTPASDSIEKLMELAGPLVYDMSRNMERSLRDVGEMFKSCVFQFYTVARKVQVLGPDGLTEEDFDFDPDNMIPSHFPWEDDRYPSGVNRVERAKWHQNNFVFHVVPNSLHQITQMTRKLLYLQLQKAGVPIDPWTLAEVFDIPNFGRPPDGANTVMERWEAFQSIAMEIQTALQIQAQTMMMAASPQGQAMGALSAIGQAMGGGQEGRPPSGQEAPQMLDKKDENGVPRQTISESGDGGPK